ncbi:hypothetical protein WAE56_03910 [Iodobacter sp. LRB]|uniref:hypothetical protein n=1 Tax=unclassified Iodobacter TaxID=235634 RepID=UPI000C123A55|nr:hypothetical protein [Iodobacter sp. BJB302]
MNKLPIKTIKALKMKRAPVLRSKKTIRNCIFSPQPGHKDIAAEYYTSTLVILCKAKSFSALILLSAT